MVLNYPNS